MAAASSSFTTPAPPTAVQEAVRRLIAERRYTGADGPADDPSHLAFRTRKTMFSWELDVLVTILPTATGSSVTVTADVAQGRPSALMDGVKNQKAADKLATDIQAAIR